MNSRIFRSILALPFNAVVTIPAVILISTRRTRLRWRAAGPRSLRFWIALALLGAGAAMFVWTNRAFAGIGGGTLAPWDPTQRLVVAGVYRHVRNPMISAVICMIAGEAVLFGSPGVAIWAVIFTTGNATFIPLLEEPDLAARLGDDYRTYAANVPRWIPRIRAWDPDVNRRL